MENLWPSLVLNIPCAESFMLIRRVSSLRECRCLSDTGSCLQSPFSPRSSDLPCWHFACPQFKESRSLPVYRLFPWSIGRRMESKHISRLIQICLRLHHPHRSCTLADGGGCAGWKWVMPGAAVLYIYQQFSQLIPEHDHFLRKASGLPVLMMISVLSPT